LRVGKASLSGLVPAALSAMRTAAAGAVDIVFIRDLDPRLRDLHTLDWTGLVLADLKARLTRSLGAGSLPDPGAAGTGFEIDAEPRPEDGAALEGIVERIADRSRFVDAFG